MKYYAVAEVNVTDPTWVSEYSRAVTPIIEEYGGKYLARTGNYEIMEGNADRHQSSIILEFPSKEAAYAFYNSEQYKPYLEARLAGSTGKFYFAPAEGATNG